MQLEDVFGISPEILEKSYVDRKLLDKKMQKILKQKKHITIYGSSKCGKSWFRQKNIPKALTVQCRHGMKMIDIYVDALSQLEIRFKVEESSENRIKGMIEATGDFGFALLCKITGKTQLSGEKVGVEKYEIVGQNIDDLRYIADIINQSERKLVIEDFHYMNSKEKEKFAYDLKTLWDYKCYVVVIGVWSQSGYLNTLNPDLAIRTKEISIIWDVEDLEQVILEGSSALNVKVSDNIVKEIVNDSYGNVGILQNLVYNLFQNAGINEKNRGQFREISDMDYYLEATNELAEDLNAIYQHFAKVVSKGLRNRGSSATEIYAHALAVILESDDNDLIIGIHLDDIFHICHSRQPRIIKPNLTKALGKIEELQVDGENRGLVLAYNDNEKIVLIIDRQLLFYRKYRTVNWPWQELIDESNS
ncbi:hypothetical protein [Exiguobacterium aurantiacum]|uniref:hypothetical protein n=1 Tax=Exiguobacterium aurantiacum TaxID=33987 RepID=UPI000877734F|nr:hypothetical protein [Exiguobacterium aurantiacum]